MSDTKIQTQEAQKTPYQIKDKNKTKQKNKNKNKTAPRHIIFKLQKMKDKEIILKEARENKHLT